MLKKINKIITVTKLKTYTTVKNKKKRLYIEVIKLFFDLIPNQKCI